MNTLLFAILLAVRLQLLQTEGLKDLYPMLRFYTQQRNYKRVSFVSFPTQNRGHKDVGDWESALNSILVKTYLAKEPTFYAKKTSSNNFLFVKNLSSEITSFELWIRNATFIATRNQHILIVPLHLRTHLAFMKKFMLRKEMMLNPVLLVTNKIVHKLLDEIELPINNRLEIAKENEFNSFEFWEVYRPIPNTSYKITQTGLWRPDNDINVDNKVDEELNYLLPGEPWSRRTDLAGMLIKCTTTPMPPNIYLKHNKDGTVRISGVLGSLFNVLQEKLNFTSECREPKNTSIGLPNEKGQWTGIIGDLVSGRADVGISATDVTNLKNNYVDFLTTLLYNKYVIVIKTPSTRENVYTNYFRVFTYDVWLVLIAFIVSVAVLIKVTSLLLTEAEISFSFTEVIIYVIGSLCSVGNIEHQLAPSSITGRMLYFYVIILSYPVIAYYNSLIISFLINRDFALPFHDLEELYKDKKDYNFGFNPTGSLVEFFKDSKVEYLKEVWNDLSILHPEDIYTNDTEALLRVQNEKYAYIISESYLLNTLFDCSYTIIPGRLFNIPIAFPLPKESPLYPLFNYQLIKMRESGIVSVIHRRWNFDPNKLECDSSPFRAMDIGDVTSALAFISILIVMSFVILAVEVLVDTAIFHEFPHYMHELCINKLAQVRQFICAKKLTAN